MYVKLISHTEEPMWQMAVASSNCYNSKINMKTVTHCHNSGHDSILEFADFHFKIEGISRACSMELIRSRLASIAQRSQRYVKEDGFKYVTPITISDNEYEVETPYLLGIDMDDTFPLDYETYMQISQNFYKSMIEAGVPPEDARMVLPNACETVIDFKCNYRELMHFCNQRLCYRSQWEIRELAREFKRLVAGVDEQLGTWLVPMCQKHTPYVFCTEGNQCKELENKIPKLKDIYNGYLQTRNSQSM